MASGFGSITLKSIDYTGAAPSGTCANADNVSSFGRGAFAQTHNFSWETDNARHLKLNWTGYTAESGGSSWIVCSVNGYSLEVQYSEDQNNWTTLGSSFLNNDQTQSCSTYPVIQMMPDLVAALPNMTVPGNGYIRVWTYTERACPTTALPNAYPTSIYSQAVTIATPIIAISDYRPGAIYTGGSWVSLNQQGGKCNILIGGTQTEMRTQANTTIPPTIYKGSWVSQSKIGNNA